MQESPPTVHALRSRWQPHKDRLAVIRGDHPTAIRFHRACSWLSHVEKYDPIKDVDQVLTHQWIAFNSLYGEWDEVALEPASDRRCWQTFLERVMSLDRAGHLVSMLQDHKPLVFCVLEDEIPQPILLARPVRVDGWPGTYRSAHAAVRNPIETH